MEIAVIGATGFVGSNICRILETAGFSITPFDRLATENILARGIDPGKRFDWVVNCSGGTKNIQDVNADLPAQLFQHFNPQCDGGFLHVSSVAAGQSVTPAGVLVDEDRPDAPDTDYGRSKKAGEDGLRALKKSTDKLCLLRPPILYGADAKGVFSLLRKAAALGLPLPVKNLTNLRHFMFVDNFAHAVASAITANLDGTYYVVDHPAKTVSAFYDAMCLANGKRAKRRSLGPMTRPILSALLGARAPSLIENSCYDDRRFRQATGFEAPIDFAAAIARAVGNRSD